MPYKNPEEAKKRSLEYYEKNKEIIKQKVMEHYYKNRIEINQKRREKGNGKELYWQNREAALQRKYKYDHSEKGAAHRRAYHKKHREIPEVRAKAHARDLARYHIVALGACEDCGKTEKLHRHHQDYSKPLEIKILCYDCHLKIHGKKPSEASK
jgi:hypothetical protein